MIAQKITVNDGQHYIISITNVMLGIYSMIMGAFAYLNNHQFSRDTEGMEVLDSCCICYDTTRMYSHRNCGK